MALRRRESNHRSVSSGKTTRFASTMKIEKNDSPTRDRIKRRAGRLRERERERESYRDCGEGRVIIEENGGIPFSGTLSPGAQRRWKLNDCHCCHFFTGIKIGGGGAACSSGEFRSGRRIVMKLWFPSLDIRHERGRNPFENRGQRSCRKYHFSRREICTPAIDTV